MRSVEGCDREEGRPRYCLMLMWIRMEILGWMEGMKMTTKPRRLVGGERGEGGLRGDHRVLLVNSELNEYMRRYIDHILDNIIHIVVLGETESLRHELFRSPEATLESQVLSK